MANNVGPKLFSKTLSDTDAYERLHWPSRHLHLLPFGGNPQLEFNIKDLDGRLWRFKCSKRVKGNYEKPVISSGWKPFIDSKGGLNAGDKVIFYRNENPMEALFVVSVCRNVPLFGNNINDVEE